MYILYYLNIILYIILYWYFIIYYIIYILYYLYYILYIIESYVYIIYYLNIILYYIVLIFYYILSYLYIMLFIYYCILAKQNDNKLPRDRLKINPEAPQAPALTSYSRVHHINDKHVEWEGLWGRGYLWRSASPSAWGDNLLPFLGHKAEPVSMKWRPRGCSRSGWMNLCSQLHRTPPLSSPLAARREEASTPRYASNRHDSRDLHSPLKSADISGVPESLLVCRGNTTSLCASGVGSHREDRFTRETTHTSLGDTSTFLHGGDAETHHVFSIF